MSLNVSEIGFQNNALEQKSTLASVDAYFSSELNLKTSGESNASYHYNGSAYIYGNIGVDFAEALIEMN
jgi:hypothetical protein